VNAKYDLRVLVGRVLAARRAVPAPVWARIDASVVRTLTSLLNQPAETVAESASPGIKEGTATLSIVLWDLAQQVTSAYTALGSVELFEGAAALQDLACRAAESDAVARERLNWINTEVGNVKATIRLSPVGPLLIKNVERFLNWLGEPLPSRPLMALCRCGASSIQTKLRWQACSDKVQWCERDRTCSRPARHVHRRTGRYPRSWNVPAFGVLHRPVAHGLSCQDGTVCFSQRRSDGRNHPRGSQFVPLVRSVSRSTASKHAIQWISTTRAHQQSK
jgi:hypothetical protein